MQKTLPASVPGACGRRLSRSAPLAAPPPLPRAAARRCRAAVASAATVEYKTLVSAEIPVHLPR